MLLIIGSDCVHMEPTKEFFINILVKDISLEKAILDLIDNSIDSVKEMDKNLSNYKIRLTLNKRKFIIEDNCNGISQERAKNYAFKFGNDNTQNSRSFSIGHYDIGMKRAFFRIGKNIKVESTTKKDFFSLILDVNKWGNSPKWDIEFSKSGVNDGLKSMGTKIQIKMLREEASISFENDDFIRKLRDSISKTYKKFIKRGITIVVNGEIIVITRRNNETEIERKKIDKKNYTADIIIKRDIIDYDESGWYVYLNDRLVVKADKTDLTGWNIGGEEQYYGIRGYVYIRAKQEGILPFTTTKEGLDTSNTVYKEVKVYMIQILKKSLGKGLGRNVTMIKYEKPREEVEKMKQYLKVKHAKNIGEKTYEEYVRKHKIKF